MASRVRDSSEDTDLEVDFRKATNHLQSLAAELDSAQLLAFYGLYKQATVGPCDTPKPSWYQTVAKEKWETWKSLGGMSRVEAMTKYVYAIDKLDPSWKEEEEDKSQSWVAVSRLMNPDDDIRDDQKTLFDWVKDCNKTKVWEFLEKHPESVNAADDEGMLPVHWAADRGHVPTIRCLVEAGARINAADADGQTALHYAASCGHEEAIKYLLTAGAESVKDKDGMTPKDVADEQVAAMFR